jgi:signal transduction histidine kinase
LEYRPDGVQLWIRDNGVGFDRQIQNDLAAGTSLLGGFGLMGMCERVVALGGALQLSNKGGAQVLAEIPRSAAHGPAEL